MTGASKADNMSPTKEIRWVMHDHRAVYPEPVIIQAGDELIVGHREDSWSGWVWCTNRMGQSRWVPESYIERKGDVCVALRHYEATELTVKAGEKLIVDQEESGWAWCTNERGESGWVPEENLDEPSRGECTRQDDRAGCVFCHMPRRRLVEENQQAFAVRDLFPVTALHTLIIPKRHVPSYFDLSQQEVAACHELLLKMGEAIVSLDAEVKGFNIGINQGIVAGQTIPHCHMHLIPRRVGDVAEPRGGVRHMIPGKGCYERHAGR